MIFKFESHAGPYEQASRRSLTPASGAHPRDEHGGTLVQATLSFGVTWAPDGR